VNPALYYDGNCPLCNKEISFLKRIVGSQIDFIDVHGVEASSTTPSKEALLRRLHLMMPSGDWVIGLDANVFVWSKTRYGPLFKILRLWPISVVADFVYAAWADRRYKKRYECDVCNI